MKAANTLHDWGQVYNGQGAQMSRQRDYVTPDDDRLLGPVGAGKRGAQGAPRAYTELLYRRKRFHLTGRRM